MSRNQSPQLVAGGNISPSTFVKVSTAADNTALQAGANEGIIGISQVGLHQPPGVTGSDAYAAVAGENIEIFGLGDICLLKSASGWTRGDFLKSDANGLGVTIATSGVMQNIGAQALESAATNEFGRVQIIISTAIVPGTSGALTATDITGTDSSLGITGLAGSAGSAGGAIPIIGGAGDTNGAGGAVGLTGGAGAGSGLGGAATLTGGLGGATNAIGGAATVTAGQGSGTGNGAVASLVGGASGAGGATGTGGIAKIVGGASVATNGSGGAAQVTGGVSTGNGTGGAVTLTGGASGGASGTGGSVNIASGAPTGGTDGSVNVQTVTTGKLGFFAATAITKYSTTGDQTTAAAGSSTTVFLNTTFTGNNGSTAYKVGDIVACLKAYGLLTT